MTERAYEWDPRAPTKGERIVCGIWLVAFVAAAADYYAGWHWFSGYDKWVFGGLFLASLFLFPRLPGVRRVEGAKRPLTYWVIIVLCVVGAIILSMFKPGS
jgi:hypothetical protein